MYKDMIIDFKSRRLELLDDFSRMYSNKIIKIDFHKIRDHQTR